MEKFGEEAVEMQEYILDTETGILAATKKEKLSNLRILSLEEFQKEEQGMAHKKDLTRSLRVAEYCKIENFPGCMLGTMRVPRAEKEIVKMHTFGFYLKDQQLIFIEDGTFVKENLDQMTRNAYGRCGLQRFLLLMLEHIIEEDVIYLQKQEEALSELEEALLHKIPEHFYERILIYRKRLTQFHTYYEQLMNIGDLMQTNLLENQSPEEQLGWQLFSNHAQRLHDHVERLKEYLVQLRELYQSLIDVQQNKVMSILTIVTTIFFPLTLIAGWYGMNFPNMPELQWKYAYPAVIIVSLLIITVEIIYFRRKKML